MQTPQVIPSQKAEHREIVTVVKFTALREKKNPQFSYQLCSIGQEILLGRGSGIKILSYFKWHPLVRHSTADLKLYEHPWQFTSETQTSPKSSAEPAQLRGAFIPLLANSARSLRCEEGFSKKHRFPCTFHHHPPRWIREVPPPHTHTRQDKTPLSGGRGGRRETWL